MTSLKSKFLRTLITILLICFIFTFNNAVASSRTCFTITTHNLVDSAFRSCKKVYNYKV